RNYAAVPCYSCCFGLPRKSSDSTDSCDMQIFGLYIPQRLMSEKSTFSQKVRNMIGKIRIPDVLDVNVKELILDEKIGRNLIGGDTMMKIRQNTYNFRNPNFPPKLFYPINLMVEDSCSDPQRYDFKGYQYEANLGRGIQGKVFRMSNGDKTMALKQFTNLADFLAQINSLLALTMIDYPMKLLGMMRSPNPPVEYTDHNYRALSKVGQFCVMMPYIEGRSLAQVVAAKIFNQLRNIYTKREYQLTTYRIIIKILRDVQLLHFSFNRYPHYQNSPIYGEYSYTLFHGDLLVNNILVQRSADNKIITPFLIDVGFHFGVIMNFKNEIIGQFYNKYLLKAGLPISDRNQFTVHRHQLLNMMQQLDFCMIAILIMDSFHQLDDFRELPANICRGIFDWSRQNDMPFRHQKITAAKGTYHEIIMKVLSFTVPLLNYQETWLNLYNFLYDEMTVQILS
ncbi:hypothetical protein SNEBB_008287, partial [Seison nebaliae]